MCQNISSCKVQYEHETNTFTIISQIFNAMHAISVMFCGPISWNIVLEKKLHTWKPLTFQFEAFLNRILLNRIFLEKMSLFIDFLKKWYSFPVATLQYPISFICWTPVFRRNGVLPFHHCQYVSISVGKRIFSKMAHRIFLKLVMKSGCLRVKNWRSWIFGKKSYFGDNTQKHPQNSFFFLILQKI